MKVILNFFFFILALPFFLIFKLSLIFLEERKAINGCSQLLSAAPGLFGVYLRRAFYRLALKECSDDCYIGFGTLFSTTDVVIGKKVYIGHYCIIGRSEIRDRTLVASRVSIISGKNQHGTEDLDQPISEQEGSFEKVTIGKACWIGEGAIVAADVEDNSIVSTGAVVLKPVASGMLAVGNPCKVLPRT